MSNLKLTVSAGVRDRFLCPVSVTLDTPGVGALHTGDTEVACQSIPVDGGKCELRFIVDRLAAGTSREFVATPGDSPGGGHLRLQDDGASISLLQSGDLLSTYHLADPNAARPYWYPLFDPHGGRCTRGYPMDPQPGEREDHPHHKSMWVAYGEVNGTDNWSEMPGHATMRHESWNTLAAGPVYALFDHNLTWVSNVGDVTFGDTKEGGLLSMRVTTSMDVPHGRIENAVGGVNEDETWGKRAHWCDYSGPVDGNWVGVAVFDHPTSFRHPTWWHVRNYGLMTANCFGLSHFTNGQADGTHVLPAGDTLRFCYRVYFHAGDAKQGRVATKYHDFIHPPAVAVG
ncbi:MAG: PmoA family protein [Armatimonadetes bacterium]|nr:PmoA family protein [Armatimonadota bacterium]